MNSGEYLRGSEGFTEEDSFKTWGDSCTLGDSGLEGATATFERYIIGFKTM